MYIIHLCDTYIKLCIICVYIKNIMIMYQTYVFDNQLFLYVICLCLIITILYAYKICTKNSHYI